MKQLWEFMSGGKNNFPSLICKDRTMVWGGVFDVNGKPKQWAEPPQVEPFFEKRKKVQKSLADISYLAPGAIILHQKAYSVLNEFLGQFGEFLQMDCLGQTVYFYNITNLVSCVDFDSSEKSASGGAILKAAFSQDRIPNDVQIFKDPLTAGIGMYATETAKEALEKIIANENLTGITFFKAGENWC